jgi:HD-GYP domain-containing protein (c-di-GMP phosphodiesterase class II)
MAKKQIPVSELRLGMYVVELDRPWLGSGFAFQGFPLTTEDEIQQIRSCCKHVFVDPEREKWSPERAATQEIRGTTVYREQAPVEQELPIAKAIYARYADTARQLFQKLRSEGGLDPELLMNGVKSMTESINRNPDAMLLLNRIYAQDSYELARALDTSILMITFGRFLQLAVERLELLGLAGLLLDIGKAALPQPAPVPRPVYLREHDETVKAHVAKSVELVRANPGLPRGLDEIVAQHHERQDGGGYPRGLTAAEISIEGAIAAIIDTFSELTCARGDAEVMSPSNALNTLHKLRETLFHEALVEQFIQCIGIYPVGSAVELNTGEIGLVIAQNLVRRLQPRVMVILDKNRAPLPTHKILDLVKLPKAHGDEVYRIRRTLPKDALPIDVKEFFV